MNSAAEEFFAKGYGQTGPKISQANIISLFNRYKDPQTNQMEGDGIANFFDQLGVDASSDPVALVISYYMGAQSMGTYSQQEFVQGLTKLQCDSLEALKKKVPSLA